MEQTIDNLKEILLELPIQENHIERLKEIFGNLRKIDEPKYIGGAITSLRCKNSKQNILDDWFIKYFIFDETSFTPYKQIRPFAKELREHKITLKDIKRYLVNVLGIPLWYQKRVKGKKYTNTFIGLKIVDNK